MLWGERRGQWHHRRSSEPTERPMPQLNDLSRSLVVLEQDATLIAVIEMGQSNWLVAGIVPGVERSPLKKLAVDESALLKLLNRWREEAEKAGHRIERIAISRDRRTRSSPFRTGNDRGLVKPSDVLYNVARRCFSASASKIAFGARRMHKFDIPT